LRNIGYGRIKNVPTPSELAEHHTGPSVGYELTVTRRGKALSSHRTLRVAKKHITNKLESFDSSSSVPWSLYRIPHSPYGQLDLDAGWLARSQNPEGPATGHLDPGFLGFPGS